MWAMLHQYREEFPCRQPVLCHGDMEPEHIFVGLDLQLAGVIDFGQVLGGPPMEDFIHLSFVQPALDLASVRSGYPDGDMVHDRFDRRLHLHRLGFLMECVAHVTRAGDVHADKTPDPSSRLRETLAALRQWWS
jgi:aminoglycoside phosphotransferase (APT) family kinase protein